MQFAKKNWWLLLIFALISIFILYDFFNQDSLSKVTNDEYQQGTNLVSGEDVPVPKKSIEKEESELLFIDVKGEVEFPGVYEVAPNNRVNDVIILAGGFTENANMEHVNLAQKVFDEMVILVTKKGEEGGSSQDSAEQFSDGRIRINRATKDELLTLTGIGSVKAEAIIQYRTEYGDFQSEDDLLQVSGIGEKTLDRIREEILVP
ncbi:ComEA family DNA-binding protein [Aquibacillus halophilus]|uniref:ComEA family DNA-binding protein n=1 Tax=Aquibacillus halophilus TaxID=930132 RepID=A0A6A8DCR8_9BACI|nr:helix-hairpin-helix domain-containing protein [Aquibacillus halophilus]MRH43060.1 ComEA family DNA-binding protein [Aquibacillus halophilus]